MRLLSIMSKHKPSMQLQALSTMMKLLSLEGKYPIDNIGIQEYYFPIQKLRVSTHFFAVVSRLNTFVRRY
jgi:hypothetical protein